GAEAAPDTVRLVWKHRRSADEIPITAQIERKYGTTAGMRVDVSAVTDARLLDRRGHWDAFIEADWSGVHLRARMGSRRDESLDTTTVLLGSPTMAAMYFTPYGNLSFDVGPTKKYPGDQVRTPAVVTGVMTISRRRVAFVEGSVSDVVSVCFVSGRAGRRGAAYLLALTWQSVAVVLPRSRRRAHERGLVNAAGDIEYVSIDRLEPPSNQLWAGKE